jgi:DNA invertase Pin-like site-specific DNA recombinase
MKVGYARVSTKDQDLLLQLDALKKAGCEKIYQDTQSGKSKDRLGLKLALEVLRKGDSLIVWKLDRLGRKARDLSEMVEDLEKTGIDFVSLTDNIDTSSAAGRFFFNVMASLAQMERELMLERTKAGLDAARLKGRVGGRKRKMTESKVTSAKNLLGAGALPKDVAKDLGVSIATLYRWIPADHT